MASDNQLLGSGKPAGTVEERVVSRQPIAWRFHKDCPQGKLVYTKEELEKLDKADWKDHPGKVQKLPGHEKVWEDEQFGDDESDK